jgi:NAD(P)H dehydrogenase (quinone)
MNVLIILAHPHQGSFNHAIASVARELLRGRGHQVVFHDLYGEQFEPRLPHEEIPADGKIDPTIITSCKELQEAQGIIFVHPNWWGQPPAILKGWIDRVLRPGVAYTFLEGDSGEGVPIGLLKGKMVLVFNTSNTPEEREKKVFGDPLEILWKKCICQLCGVSTFYRRTFSVVVTSTESQRRGWLGEVEAAITAILAT